MVPVPKELLAALAGRGEKLEPELLERWKKNGARPSGTWAQVFGDDEWGQEVFTAWHYARFVGRLGQGRQGALRHPDVRQRCAESHRPQARRISQRRPAAASARCVEGRRAVARFPRARHLLPELRAARGTLRTRGQPAVHSRSQQRHQSARDRRMRSSHSASSIHSASRRFPSSRWAMRRMHCRSPTSSSSN